MNDTLHMLWNGLKILLRGLFWCLRTKGKGIVIVTQYPYPECEQDGYFQRIKSIDGFLSSYTKIYAEAYQYRIQPFDDLFSTMGDKTAIIRTVGSSIDRRIACLLTMCIIFRFRKVYFHSVHRVEPYAFLFYIPFIQCFLDMHGIVPEEMRLAEEFGTAYRMEKLESLAVRKAKVCITVTDTMQHFLHKKYSQDIACSFITLPIIEDTPLAAKYPTRPDGKPAILYAGGLAPWQQIPEMLDAMAASHAWCHFELYCTTPERLQNMLPEALGDLKAKSLPHAELLARYPHFQYGFVLRTNDPINRVACPTKLVEYVAFGIIPIVDSPMIGDFLDLGMRYVPLEALRRKALPDFEELADMRAANRAVFEKLREKHYSGSQLLLKAIG